MAEVGTAAAWLLAVVFAWAALSKARDRAGTADSLAALGVPAPRGWAVGLPVGEAALVAALVTRPALGAALAGVALLAFSAVLADRLRRGVTARCGCFGAAGAAPVSNRTLARNGLLVLAAAVALAADGPGIPTLPAVMAVTVAALLGATGLALADLRASTGRLLALGPLPSLPSEEEPSP